MSVKERIAKRVVQELLDGTVVNLGIGLPTLVANYLPSDTSIIIQAENGILGVGPAAAEGKEDKDIFNAGGVYVTTQPGAAFLNSAESFAVIRGGHVHTTVLGALQVDERGNLASWMVPGKKIPGMGGAMDLVVGSKHVIVAMEHTAKGLPKLLKRCTFPITASGVVNKIITEMAVIEIVPEGMLLQELGDGFTVEDVQAVTEATLIYR